MPQLDVLVVFLVSMSSTAIVLRIIQEKKSEM